MKNNEVMVVVIAISSFIVGLSFSYEIFRIPAIIAAWVGGAAAAYIFLKAETVEDNVKKVNLASLLNKLNTLEGEERRIFEEIIAEEGEIMQSELVEKSRLSKASVSRILDKLEGKGLIIRQRYGMGDIVLLR